MSGPRPLSILVADDEEDDRELTRRALIEARLLNDLEFATGGDEVMQRLLRKERLPGLILLDLNMPKKDGFEVLRELRAHPDLRKIPVVVLTTSNAKQDILQAYDLGANSFITKPPSFAGLVRAMTTLNQYWFQLVELPGSSRT